MSSEEDALRAADPDAIRILDWLNDTYLDEMYPDPVIGATITMDIENNKILSDPCCSSVSNPAIDDCVANNGDYVILDLESNELLTKPNSLQSISQNYMSSQDSCYSSNSESAEFSQSEDTLITNPVNHAVTFRPATGTPLNAVPPTNQFFNLRLPEPHRDPDTDSYLNRRNLMMERLNSEEFLQTHDSDFEKSEMETYTRIAHLLQEKQNERERQLATKLEHNYFSQTENTPKLPPPASTELDPVPEQPTEEAEVNTDPNMKLLRKANSVPSVCHPTRMQTKIHPFLVSGSNSNLAVTPRPVTGTPRPPLVKPGNIRALRKSTPCSTRCWISQQKRLRKILKLPAQKYSLVVAEYLKSHQKKRLRKQQQRRRHLQSLQKPSDLSVHGTPTGRLYIIGAQPEPIEAEHVILPKKAEQTPPKEPERIISPRETLPQPNILTDPEKGKRLFIQDNCVRYFRQFPNADKRAVMTAIDQLWKRFTPKEKEIHVSEIRSKEKESKDCQKQGPRVPIITPTLSPKNQSQILTSSSPKICSHDHSPLRSSSTDVAQAMNKTPNSAGKFKEYPETPNSSRPSTWKKQEGRRLPARPFGMLPFSRKVQIPDCGETEKGEPCLVSFKRLSEEKIEEDKNTQIHGLSELHKAEPSPKPSPLGTPKITIQTGENGVKAFSVTFEAFPDTQNHMRVDEQTTAFRNLGLTSPFKISEFSDNTVEIKSTGQEKCITEDFLASKSAISNAQTVGGTDLNNNSKVCTDNSATTSVAGLSLVNMDDTDSSADDEDFIEVTE